ncbi:MAG: hypothetical protein JST00_43525 [Deltaproteobacteria bacterium]|nr:hypothetical protein [Deltaproteobacteria bacterium]
MNGRLFAFTASLALPAALLFACATDNGETVYGEQFGPTPTRPDGSADGPIVVGDDSGAKPDADAAPGDGEAGPPSCAAGTIAILAGRGTPTPSLSGAVQEKGGAWKGSAIVGGAAEDVPALVAFGSGFLGVVHGAGDALQTTSYGTSWSAPTSIGIAEMKHAPSLAVVGTKAHVVYAAGAAGATNFFHGVNSGTSWDAANDPVGSPQAFGNAPAGLSAAGSDLAFAQAGSNNGLYVQTWNGAWTMYQGNDGIDGVDGAGAAELAGAALESVTGKFDVVLVYADKSGPNKVRWVARDATTKLFTAPADVNASATTYAATVKPMSLTRVSASSLLLTFEGTDGKGYYVAGTLGAAAITWSTPAPLAAGGVSVDSTPRAAKGVCGDDAVIAFASGGQVKVVRLRGSTLTAPELVVGASGSRVAIATR